MPKSNSQLRSFFRARGFGAVFSIGSMESQFADQLWVEQEASSSRSSSLTKQTQG